MTPRAPIAVVLALLAAASNAADSEEATRAARELLASRLGKDPSHLAVVSVETTQWPDASLGCGPAMGAAPQPLRGHRVLLRADGEVHAVHVAGSQARLCGAGLKQSPGSAEDASMKEQPQPEPADPPSRALVDKARADLQRRLSLQADDIALIEFKSVVWPDSSLGCPRPGMAYTQVQRDGVLIRFNAKGRTYQYHGGSGREPFLCENPAQ
jgi:hypothetical protein